MIPQIFGEPENEQEFLLKNGDHHANKFLLDNITYHFPDYVCSMSFAKNKLTFKLLVDDVLPQSPKMVVDDDERAVSLKFCVIKLDPHEAKHYAFMVKLPVLCVEDVDLTLRPTHVLLTIPFQQDDEELTWYLCGRTDSELEKKTLSDYERKLEDTYDDASPDSSNSSIDLDFPVNNGVWRTTDL